MSTKPETIKRKQELTNTINSFNGKVPNNAKLSTLEYLANYYQNKAKEINYTLQDCYNKNEKEKFVSLVWCLSADRQLSEHEASELLEIYFKWDYFQTNFPSAKIVNGNLGYKRKE